MKASFLILSLLVAFLTLAAVEQFKFPIASLTAEVIDETGAPVQGATVKMTFQNPVSDLKNWGTGRGNKIISGQTNAAGLCTLSDHCDGELGGGVRKEGFYRGWWQPYKFGSSAADKWQPWNPTVQVVLKKFVNPIPMYAKRAQIEIPSSDQRIGFDLIECDWVAPHGKGKVSDFLFALQRRFATPRDYESVVTVTFSNPGDGLHVIEAQPEYASELKLPRTAPDSGYMPEITTSIAAAPGGPGHEDARANRNYLFRVRTILNQNNQPVSGLYGKIDGDIRLDSINSKTCILLFTYYLNPTPNDRNLEFDPKRNLFTNLKGEERVTAP